MATYTAKELRQPLQPAHIFTNWHIVVPYLRATIDTIQHI